jgi:hypothetical protein
MELAKPDLANLRHAHNRAVNLVSGLAPPSPPLHPIFTFLFRVRLAVMVVLFARVTAAFSIYVCTNEKRQASGGFMA